ncbi:MAG TPA: hypothetical protein VLJ59_15515 [Mycobacteriales bacterium]|nr:hypothetical protein [Mycobacteriales bacterium]
MAVVVDARTGAGSVKATNLAARPDCALSVEDGPRAVVVEGAATLAPAPPEVLAAYGVKYPESIPAGEPVFCLAPRVVFGLSEVEGEFVRSTRWTFRAQSFRAQSIGDGLASSPLVTVQAMPYHDSWSPDQRRMMMS